MKQLFARFALVCLLGADSSWAVSGPSEVPPARREISIDDLVRLRDVDQLSISPDGRDFAILVRQVRAAANAYQLAWYVGSPDGGSMREVGDAGEVRFTVSRIETMSGDFQNNIARWSDDSKWLAYTRRLGDDIQIWRSQISDGRQERVSSNVANVLDFAWSSSGRTLCYTVGAPRYVTENKERTLTENGFPLREFSSFADMVNIAGRPRTEQSANAVWIVDAAGGNDRVADPDECRSLRKVKDQGLTFTEAKSDVFLASQPRPDGALAILVRESGEAGLFPHLRLAERTKTGAKQRTVLCRAVECAGQVFRKMWWVGRDVLFWRKEGINSNEDGFYKWSPRTGTIRSLLRDSDAEFSACEYRGARLVCLRELPTIPRHVVSIDVSSGNVRVIADVNPDFREIRLGRVERIEWDLPQDHTGLGYPKRGRGYVILPVDFDPNRKYPVIICPYHAGGFKRGDGGDEQPMLAYASRGFIVLNTDVPWPWGALATDNNFDLLRREYSFDAGFPHLNMLVNSTRKALEVLLRRGIVDEARIGMGGVSHGAFIPLFMLQKYDMLAAISVGSPGWTQSEYYFSTSRGRLLYGQLIGEGEQWPEDAGYWQAIDIADHVDEIEAPILFNLADREALAVPRLIRKMEASGKPFDAYIYPNEYHFKWQPAHRYSIYRRNMDWFRFWLQDYEDPDSMKQDQYVEWRRLRALQCMNRRVRSVVCQR